MVGASSKERWSCLGWIEASGELEGAGAVVDVSPCVPTSSFREDGRELRERVEGLGEGVWLRLLDDDVGIPM